MRHWFRHLRHSNHANNRESGIAAVEFALIAPFLAILVIGVIDIGRFVSDRGQITRSVQSGVQYFMVGGEDTQTAQAIIKNNLSDALGNRDNSTVAVTQFCQCGDVISICNQNCSDGTVPQSFYRMTLLADHKGILFRRTHQVSDDVRVR